MRLERLVMLGAVGLAGCRGRAPEIQRDVAERIVAAALADGGAWDKLAWLTDHIGNRLSGTPQLEAAVAWAGQAMIRDGHEHVRAEPVTVTVWQRGQASAEIVSPVHAPMAILALGATSSTPPEGIESEIVLVGSFEELEARRAEVPGKIVVFDQPMPAFDGSSHYDVAVKPRGEGPMRVSLLGGAAVLVRSVTARSLRSPHTGNTRFKDAVPIPAAALATEDAARLRRLVESGEKVRVHFTSTARVVGQAESANVLAELVGREHPEEIVLLGAHLDSWDVGQGAHDDGAGCVIIMQALTVLRRLGLQPRRTIRVVLFTNEENGVAGGKAYRKTHKGERHVAAIESDSGGFQPRGWTVDEKAAVGEEIMVGLNTRVAPLLGKIGRLVAKRGGSGTDIEDLAKDGALTLGHSVDGSTYFDYHHTEADTLDKVDPADLRRNVAVMALTAWWLAERDYP